MDDSETLLVNQMIVEGYYFYPHCPCTTCRCPGTQGYLIQGHILLHNTNLACHGAEEGAS